MPLNLIDLEGVYLTDAGLFAKDCSFPITHMTRSCPPDAFIQNLPTFMGEWADDQAVPVITDQSFNIDTTGITDPDCDTAVVDIDLDGCEFIAPNQIELDLETRSLKWKSLVEKVCRMRGLQESQLGRLWDGQGRFLPNNPYVPDFVNIIMTVLGQVLIKEIAFSAALGDSANPRQFDGFFTQVLGWDVPATNPCADPINARQVIDWPTLTEVAEPGVDDVTAADHTITIWGEIKEVPAGLNLAQFLEDLWIPAVNQMWADKAGGVTMWEMLVRSGTERCILNAAACMQPCGLTASNIIDPDLRARYASYSNSLIGTFYPSGTTFTVKPTAYVDSTSLWFGPREIGGIPTYALIWRPIANVLADLSPLDEAYLSTLEGLDSMSDPLFDNEMLDLPLTFEDSAILWDIKKVNTSSKCLKANIQTELGMLVTARHLWLEVTGIHCDTLISICDPGITIDGDPLIIPGQPT